MLLRSLAANRLKLGEIYRVRFASKRLGVVSFNDS
jgi:hypothetical protein